MAYTTREEFAVLHALRIRGHSSTEPLAVTTGIHDVEVQHILDDAVARGLARSRTNARGVAYMLTQSGRDRRLALHRDHEAATVLAGLLPVHAALRQADRTFTELVTRWQSGSHRTEEIVQQLEALHGKVTTILTQASQALPRLARYRLRLDAAIDRLRRGDVDALARPLSESYLDVWAELHEDLHLTGGGRSAVDDGSVG